MSEESRSQANPLISAIVPVYNTAERLAPCLDALVAQTAERLEIILINDGSTDDSPAICEDYARRYPSLFRYLTGPNGGVSAARNRGLDTARGEWIAFCDSDDLAHPDLYRIQYEAVIRDRADLSCVALLDKGPNEQKIVTTFPFDGERCVLEENRVILERIFFPLLLDRRIINAYMPICLFRKSVLDTNGIRFNPKVNMMEDELFLLRYLLYANTVTATKTVLYTYLRFSQSACTRYYQSRNDFFREQNWYQRASEHRRIFLDGGLEKTYPALLPDLTFREILHEIQMVVTNPELSSSQRRTALRAISKRPECAEIPSNGMAGVFRWFLLNLPTGLPLLCRTKLRLDQVRRTISGRLKRRQTISSGGAEA